MARVSNEFEQVSGILRSRQNVAELLNALHARGIDDEDISVLMSDRTRDLHFAVHDETKAPEGTTIGGVSGGILGAIVGGLAVTGTILIPGMGLLVAGPLLGALAGAGAGAAAGGLIGALVGQGIPEHEAKFFENALKEEGNVLLIAHVPRDEAKETQTLFERFGAQHTRVYH